MSNTVYLEDFCIFIVRLPHEEDFICLARNRNDAKNKMRNYSYYEEYTDEQFDELWEDCEVGSFDTEGDLL